MSTRYEASLTPELEGYYLLYLLFSPRVYTYYTYYTYYPMSTRYEASLTPELEGRHSFEVELEAEIDGDIEVEIDGDIGVGNRRAGNRWAETLGAESATRKLDGSYKNTRRGGYKKT